MRLQKNAAVALIALSCLMFSACQNPSEANSSSPSPTPSASPAVSDTEPTPQPTAQPTPSPAPTETPSESSTSSSSTSDNSCFENAAFVGNSMLEDLNMYGIIDNADFYAKTGLTVSTVFTEKTIEGSAPIMDEVVSGSYDKVFLMFGLNELGWSYTDIFVEDYGKIIDTLLESNPNMKIYVQSLFPVSKTRSDKNLYGVTNKRIVQYNDMLKELAEKKGVEYVDVYSSMITEDGALAESASPDGVHPNMEYCKTWVQYLRDHC